MVPPNQQVRMTQNIQNCVEGVSRDPVLAHISHRFLLNTTEETDCFWPNPTTLCYLTNYIRSEETGEIFGFV